MSIGIQTEGQSPDSIKSMAVKAFSRAKLSGKISAVDIGAGRGDLVPFILPHIS